MTTPKSISSGAVVILLVVIASFANWKRALAKRSQVEAAMKGHVIAHGELVGRYTQEANNCNGGTRLISELIERRYRTFE